MVAAKEVSVDVVSAAVLSEPDNIFTLKDEQRMALKDLSVMFSICGEWL